ncbi:hypothetical protein SteCoe_6161 [Stentor coeruleus]|uniref:Importin subunit alpha n=1 Tax=Stentor coeruleus TaxID=5963 RepID=A0A1R2CQK5_9CILI|nr:hypothetical protein SteCoe_6161 [Stentor coeruleus]
MLADARILERNKYFQKQQVFDPNQRVKYSIELRKKNRQNFIKLKRECQNQENFNLPSSEIPIELHKIAPELLQDSLSLSTKLKQINYLLSGTCSDLQFCALLSILNKIVSQKSAINILLQYPELIQRTVNLFKIDCDKLKEEITKFLANLSSKTLIGIIREKELETMAIELKSALRKPYAKNLIMTFGNISSDSEDIRDCILLLEVGDILIEGIKSLLIINENMSITIWALSNFLKGSTPPFLTYINKFISIIPKIQNIDIDNILIELLWGISYIVEKPGLCLSVLNSIDIDKIISCLNPTSYLLSPSLRIIGNFCSCSNEYVDLFSKAGCINMIFQCIMNNVSRSILRESLWTLSNIATCKFWAKSILKHENLPLILQTLQSVDSEIRLEAFHVFCSTFTFSSCILVYKFVVENIEIVRILVDNLGFYTPEIVELALKIIERILESENTDNYEENKEGRIVRDEIIGCGGVDAIEKCKFINDDVFYTALVVLNKYFGDYEEYAYN